MKEIKLLAPAKINLFLEVNGRLENGYHSISSIMQTVSLYDTVKIKLNRDGGITLKSNRAYLPCDERNLAYRAAAAFLGECGDKTQGVGVAIELIKVIPVSAGLAGGSTDAAAVLLGMNKLFSEPLPESRLLELGGKLGADVPFCIKKGTMSAQGIGEQLTPAPTMPDCHIVIAIGSDMKKSTAQAYAEIDALSFEPKDMSGILRALGEGSVDGVCAELHNRFEDISPHVFELSDIMRSLGAAGSLLSGSGPSTFGIFYDRRSAKKATAALRKMGYYAWECSPIG